VLNDLRIVLTGGSGFLGSHVHEFLLRRGLPKENVIIPRSSSYDLTSYDACGEIYEDFKPDVVIHMAAEVGGIEANRKAPGRFFFSNISMGVNLVEQGRLHRLKKFIQVGTVCSYPKHCPVPFREESIWDGYPEETNAPYGVAKKSIMVMLEAYQRQYGMKSSVLIPCNLYGPGDNFDPESGHVIPGMIRRFHSAAEDRLESVICWGTGLATREFLYVEDAAEAVSKSIFVDDTRPMNIGSGEEVSISLLASMVAKICGYEGEILWDDSKPDGQPRRLIHSERAKEALGWEAKTDLVSGLRKTVDWWRSKRIV